MYDLWHASSTQIRLAVEALYCLFPGICCFDSFTGKNGFFTYCNKGLAVMEMFYCFTQ